MGKAISELIAISKSGRPLQFKQLIGLQKELDEEFIKDFALFMHPGAECSVSDHQCTVYTSKDRYIYSLFTTAIVRTAVYASKKVIYCR